jgi:small subunit ribosomal protein S1
LGDIKGNIEETEVEEKEVLTEEVPAEEVPAEEVPAEDVNEDAEVEKAAIEEIEEVNIIETLSGKATRLYNESDYSEDEFVEMFNLYDDTMKSIEQGNIVQGKVVMIANESVIVDIGFKSEGAIHISEFGDNPEIAEGDAVEVFLDDFENQEGQLVLSKQKADFMKVWDKIKEIHDNGEKVDGRLVRRIKGGIVVDLMGVDAFLPGSQIDIRQVKNFDQYIGETCELMIIKINKLRRNIVVSRRAVIEEEREKMRETILEDLEIGQVREGSVKNITDFGAFIDLGGVDGLLHITDMSWGRISHPSELVSIGDNINVKILNYEEGKTRISLGMKQLTKYPWDDIEEKYPEGATVDGKVVSTTDYGAFVELEHGIEGLVHISEMSWTQHVKHPSKIVNVGDMIKIKVLSVDKAEEKISLGIKQLEPDPWATIDERHPSGSNVVGKVRNLTNFGAFVEIEEGIDGLVHISDMSWTKRIKHPSEVMKKGDDVKVIILDIDKGNHRISLGHKQIFDDPWMTLEEKFSVNMITKGTIIRMLDRGVVVELENNIEGFVPTFQLGQDVKKPAEAFNVDDELPLKVIEFDKDQRKIVLSVREYFKEKDKSEFDEFKKAHEPQPVKLGDAFGDILGSSSKEEKKDVVADAPEAAKEEAVEVAEAAPEAVEEKTAETVETEAVEEAVEETAVEVVEEAVEETAEEAAEEAPEEETKES